MPLTYAMIEPTSKCDRNCTLCLPGKMGRDMTSGEAKLVAEELKGMGCVSVTLAGFGQARRSSVFSFLCHSLIESSEITVTVRPEDMFLSAKKMATRLNVSIENRNDAKETIVLVAGGSGCKSPFVPLFVPHIVLTKSMGDDLPVILNLLLVWQELFERITVATPVALCEDKKHRKAVRDALVSKTVWTRLRKLAEKEPKLEIYDASPRAPTCRWPLSGVYIDSELYLRPCCYLPRGGVIFGVLGQGMTLKQIYNRNPWREFRSNWKKGVHPDYCQRCPDNGR